MYGTLFLYKNFNPIFYRVSSLQLEMILLVYNYFHSHCRGGGGRFLQ